ncbi:hypothetical protein [Dysgonomonas sp. Marseille-Q5470]|uniref:hypothetical protein n=1 Tax=Dysgonomonas sp. Marseille-Q5470 TaxID=3039494 RepID=UPI0024BC87E5|nr:hypothetical protein [Dysgonomonas sp. Marseille-Q5470]MBS5979818.1 hypothetical protein [Dysgonomonas mossii]
MVCNHCGEELNTSQYRENKTLKSCPSCSVANGSYHVYHKYEEDFGVTDKRSSSSSPEGAQSYCTNCRGGNPPRTGVLCKDL